MEKILNRSVMETKEKIYWMVKNDNRDFEKNIFETEMEAKENVEKLKPQKCEIKQVNIPIIENIDLEFVEKCLKRKEEDEYPLNKYLYTPDDYEWDDVLEARERGIPIGCFGDTSDKFVIDIYHLGYPYNNVWAKRSWCNTYVCWKKIPKEHMIKAIYHLIEMGIILSKNFKVKLYLNDGNCKGYTSIFVIDLNKTSYSDVITHVNGEGMTIPSLHVYGNVRECRLWVHEEMLKADKN